MIFFPFSQHDVSHSCPALFGLLFSHFAIILLFYSHFLFFSPFLPDSFCFLPCSFTFFPIFDFYFSYFFSPDNIGWYSPWGGGGIFQYIDPWNLKVQFNNIQYRKSPRNLQILVGNQETLDYDGSQVGIEQDGVFETNRTKYLNWFLFIFSLKGPGHEIRIRFKLYGLIGLA